ncbi:rho GTPase-activating protein 6 isoform X1 [Oryzias latipes]|uniref:Rho GTPase activating protein 36 n=2 Tax=Oryzias latipes TaxID=8090 RepID=A0A3B3HWP9_ORYLA|nr:rho GTPase-activating protein 6 isoform X1 [Oryzias latipes]
MEFFYVGNHTWATMLGQNVRLQPVPIQSLSELERARLQEVALYHLEERELEFKISIPKETRKRRKSLRRRFDSFSKEKKERESAPKAFSIPLSQVIANDRAYKLQQDALKESRRDCLDLEASILRFRAEKRQFFNGNKALVGSASLTSGLSSPSANSVAPAPMLDAQSQSLSPTLQDNTSRGQRRGGLSVDSISDLVESQSRLLEALQLSHPAELELRKSAAEGRTQNKLSLNPIYRQVPRVLERCCSHIQTYGLQTVGIFRVGSSRKRVRQLREDFDRGVDVLLDEEHSVHDVAALLKEFLRDMPDPLLPRELYPAFLHANTLRDTDQLQYLQHLLYLLPPCNCDTLLRLLSLLSTVQSFAQDSIGTNEEEIPGNKMTAANLAVIFGPNLLQRERGGGGDVSPQALGMEDSTAIIGVTLMLIQNHKRLFMVSAELQQEVLMSLIQTDPDVIDYLLKRKLSGSHLTIDPDSGSEGRRDTGVSLDSLGLSSQSQSPLEPPSPLFPPDGRGGESSLSSEVFLNVLKLNQNRKARYGEVPPGKSIRHMRQFHSHHNLLSLSPSSPSSASFSRLHSQDSDSQDRRGVLGSFNLGGGRGSCSSLSSSSESSVWVRQTPQGESKPAPAANFWDFFTGKGSGSETVV